jgi:predicted nucleic acid-binding Zn finger protein
MCNVYLLCKDGNGLMPGTFNGFNDSGLALVISPSGTEYTANPGNLVTMEDAAEMLRDRRASKLVADGYLTMHLRGDRYRVWNPRVHGKSGGYVVTLGETRTCSCPDFARRSGAECKHLKGADDLLRYALVEKPTIRVTAIGVKVGADVEAAARRARFAAMVERDFGYQGPWNPATDKDEFYH